MQPHEMILAAFRPLRSPEIESVADVGARIAIPHFDAELIHRLVDTAISYLTYTPTLCHLTPPVIVVGDIHGSLHDLLRILKSGGNPPITKYLFLGDYVDRGPLSIEVITLLVALFCSCPDNVTLLRGNHEFRETSEVYGFKDEVEATYGNSYVWEEYSRLFTYLPIAAVIGKDIFCVHGGISPDLFNLSQLENIQKPIDKNCPKVVNHILWGDPTNEFNDFSESNRGKGITFGIGAASQFFAYSGMKKIIRAHQCVEGVETSLNGACITVFSSSCYKVKRANSSGILKISAKSEIETQIFPPIEKLERKDYNFVNFSEVAVIKRPLSLQTSPSNFICPQKSKNIGTSFLTSPKVPKESFKNDSDPKVKRNQIVKNIFPAQKGAPV